MKDEMPFAVRVDVEGTVQSIDHRTAELAVDGRGGPAHLCTSSPICRVIDDKIQRSESFASAHEPDGFRRPVTQEISTSCTPDLSGSGARSVQKRLSDSPASGGRRGRS